MPVGYGYVRSDEPTIVDWGAITKQATDSLLAIDEDRKKERLILKKLIVSFTKH